MFRLIIHSRVVQLILIGSVVLFTACDKGFEDMNKNPNAYTEPIIDNLFSYAIVRHTQNNGQILDPTCKQAGSWVQYFSSLTTVEWYADKYLWRQGYYDRFFQNAYRTELREVLQIIEETKNDPDQINKYAIARIWRVEVLHRVTDMYGDIPYSEAGLGYIDGQYSPKFDQQADIYADMLKELDEAALSLDNQKPAYGSADFLYNGNVEQWKRFAYSLMLRLGMRLTKVDIGMAETWVKKAIAGGVMQGMDDIAYLTHTAGSSTNWNTISNVLQGGEGVPISAKGQGISKINQTFIDHLVATNDPRLPFYATLWQGNADISMLPTYSAKEVQKGLPGGNDQSTIRNIIPDWSGEKLAEYSEINLHTVANLATPTIFMSFAEINYLLAEAALRGWTTAGDVKSYYDEGVRASLQIQGIFPNGMPLEEALLAANQYLATNPFIPGDFEKQMEQIHTQMWVSLFMVNNIEEYANWRRTGYPKLTPYNYPGNETGGTIPRRSRYATTESSLNPDRYNEAVSNQGPDLFTTRIWWDKE